MAIFLRPEGERHLLPWLDEVDLDNGFIRYFGDNTPALRRPAEAAPGNLQLLREIELYASSSHEDRVKAAPLLFFRNLGSGEGEPLTQFLGFGLIRTAHRVTQLFKGKAFTNFAYDCTLLRGRENEYGEEVLDIDWIDSRRDSGLSDIESLRLAPSSWKLWVEQGSEALNARNVRRYVDRVHAWRYADQVPLQGSPLGRTLDEVYRRYDGNAKHGFQTLAALATQFVMSEPGLAYFRGWVTPVGPDGGVDFVQRMDVGHGWSSTRLVILGQAKCRKPWPQSGNGVSAEELARVVARLRRGWIGAYVTTSYFTEGAQRELIVDEYPIVLIPGHKLARVAESLRDERGLSSIASLLDWIDDEHLRLVKAARPRPSDILRESHGEDEIAIGSMGSGDVPHSRD